MVAIKNILLFVTAVTALTIGKRDTATILSDISAINSNVQALTTAVNNYNGGVLAAIPILTASNNLDASIDKGITNAQATAPQTSAETQSVITAVNGLIPNIQTSLTALRAKKARFAADGLTGNVQSTLANLRTKTNTFSDALITISSADAKAAETAQKATIVAAFDAAIADFAA